MEKKYRWNTLSNVIVILGILVIPLMYSGLFTWAYEDPMQRVNVLKAAVVNLDQPATATSANGEKTLNLGESLEKELYKDDAPGFDWTKASLPQAKSGLEDGTYKALLLIPNNLSSSYAKLADPQSQVPGKKAQLELRTDDAVNYLQGTMATSAALALQAALSHEGAAGYIDQLLLSTGPLKEGFLDAASGADQLAAGGEQLGTGADTLVVGLGDLADGSVKIRNGALKLRDGITAYTGGVSSLNSGLGQLNSNMPKLAAGAKQVDGGVDQIHQQVAAMQPEVSKLAKSGNDLVDLLAPLSQADIDTAKINQLLNELKQAADKCAQVPPAALPSFPHCQLLTELANKQGITLQQLSENITKGQGLLTIADKLSQADPQEMKAKLNAADQGVKELSRQTALTPQAQAGKQKPTLKDGTYALANGLDQAQRGVQKLSAGASTLDKNSGQLRTGANALSGGLDSLSRGAGKASEGGKQLSGGIGKLTEGASSLEEGLRDGAQQVPTVDRGQAEKVSKAASGVADVKSVRENPVHDNGAGFAPFFMALCLWIGGIAIFLIFPALDLRRRPEESFWRCGFRSMSIGALFGALQAITVVTGLQLFLKLDAQNFGALILIAVLASIGYVAVNQACVAALGYRGRALSVILLCLQITSTGATFPVETAPKFFQFLSPLFPMTHVARTIRAAIAGGELHLGKALIVLAIWTVISWIVSFIAAARRKGQRPMPYDPALTFKKVPLVSSPLGGDSNNSVEDFDQRTRQAKENLRN
ncbi:YhgE/Pip family protein [Varibaculum prostatecancerukia]|uniref:YhgE/Pip family protein n=1 Tax=Varibaculum prostatecancerukia TaxID=2811781 RepID=UPI001C007814|nr:YhgE/Pip domain-containing protein [Varibaculum prostatecancerukia]